MYVVNHSCNKQQIQEIILSWVPIALKRLSDYMFSLRLNIKSTDEREQFRYINDMILLTCEWDIYRLLATPTILPRANLESKRIVFCDSTYIKLLFYINLYTKQG